MGSNLELDEELGGDAVGGVGGGVERGGERLELGAEEKVGRGGQGRDLLEIAVGVLKNVLPNQWDEFAVNTGVFKLRPDLAGVKD